MDIALLNLANVLHRSKHSRDATVPLHVAISLAPNVNVLYYTLGNIYAVSNVQLATDNCSLVFSQKETSWGWTCAKRFDSSYISSALILLKNF